MSLFDYKNKSQILYDIESPYGVDRVEILSDEDRAVLNIKNVPVPGISSLDDGTLELHVYNAVDENSISKILSIQDVHSFLITRNRTIDDYFTVYTNTIEFNITKFFDEFYPSFNGKLRIVLNYFEKTVLSNLTDFLITDISPSRKEARIKYIKKSNTPFSFFNGLDLLQVDSGNTDISISQNIFVNFGNDDVFLLLNILVEDDHSIVVRCYDPLPDTINVRSFCFLCKKKIDSYVITHFIKGVSTNVFNESDLIPDFSIKVGDLSFVTNRYVSLTDVLSGSGQYDSLLTSSSFKLNVDFSEYKNFVFYSSAEYRLRNFYNKLSTIEMYDSDISAYSASIVALSSQSFGTTIPSQSYLNTVRLKSDIIGGFTPYERYLYFESSSYSTSSLGERFDSSWPKSNSEYPYTLYSVTSSIASTWYENQIATASLYDSANYDRLFAALPLFIKNDDVNSDFFIFINMIGEYIDDVYLHTAEITNRDKYILSHNTGISTEFATHLITQFGSEFLTDIDSEELSSYLLNLNENDTSIHHLSGELKKNVLLKRFLNNLVFYLKSKGTVNSIHALANMFGISRDYYEIIEYGGNDHTMTLFNNTLPESSVDFTNINYSLLFNGSQHVKINWQTYE